MSYNVTVNIFRRTENEIDGVGGVLTKRLLEDYGELLLDDQEEFDWAVQRISKVIRDATTAVVIHDVKQVLEHILNTDLPDDEAEHYLILVNREDVYIEIEVIELDY